MGISRRPVPVVILGVAVLLWSGCASNAIQAEWTDPQFSGHSLSGEEVWVVCDSAEVAVERICEDRVVESLTAAGIIPVRASESKPASDNSASANPDRMVAARMAGAKALFASRVAPDSKVVNPGPTVGIGVGGFGGYSRGVGAGVGVSVPVGSERVDIAYRADMTLTDVATGKLMWTSSVATGASQDVARQMGKIASAGVAAARKARVL